MKIKEIQLFNFKGVKEATVCFDKPCLLTGENGSGKTSIIEGIRWGITGKLPENPINLEANEARVVLVFDDFSEVERTISRTKPTKVKVNGKSCTAKAAQQFICDGLNLSEENMNICTSSEVLREMFNGQLGDFLSGFVPESFTFEKLKSIVDLGDAEDDVRVLLPPEFGITELQEAHAQFFAERSVCKKQLESLKAMKTAIVPAAPARKLEEIEADIAILAAKEQSEEVFKKAIITYERAMDERKKRQNSIAKLREQADIIVAEKPNPLVEQAINEEILSADKNYTAANNLIATLAANITVFQNTLENLEKSVCPLSDMLICTTDKTVAKDEFEALLKSNQEGLAIQQTNADKALSSRKEAQSKLQKFNENKIQYSKKLSLIAAIERETSLLGTVPAKPEFVAVTGTLSKADLLAEKKDWLEWERQNKLDTEIVSVQQKYDLWNTIVKMFAPKGTVLTAIMDYYCDLFAEEIKPFADKVSYEVKFVPENGMKVACITSTGGVPVLFESLSQGEKLITTVLIQRLIDSFTGNKIMLIDDFNHLDDKNRKAVLSAVDSLGYETTVIAGTVVE